MSDDLGRLEAPRKVPTAMPLSNPWSQWAEICTARDLEMFACPTCNKEIPAYFMMFRPLGLEFWRCLGCMARTQGGGALYLARTTADGDAPSDLDGVSF